MQPHKLATLITPLLLSTRARWIRESLDLRGRLKAWSCRWWCHRVWGSPGRSHSCHWRLSFRQTRQRPHKNLRCQHRLAAAGLPKHQHPPVLIYKIQVNRHQPLAGEQLDAPLVDGAGAGHGHQPWGFVGEVHLPTAIVDQAISHNRQREVSPLQEAKSQPMARANVKPVVANENETTPPLLSR